MSYKLLQCLLVVIYIFCLGRAFYVHFITVLWKSYFNRSLSCKEGKGLELDCSNSFLFHQGSGQNTPAFNEKFINNKHSWEGKREGPDLLRIVYFLYHERWRFICASIFTASKRLSYPSSLGINVFTTYSSKPREDVGSLVVHAVLPVNQIYQCAQENCDSL